MKIHLIDGTYELFRCFFGAPKATSPDGREVGAARGLLRTLLALLRQEDVSHVAVAFDHVIESFRNQMFEGYKTGEGMDPLLTGQFPLAEEVAAALGLVVWPMIEFEADDALATAAERWASDDNVEQVLLCSPDKDLAQCVRGEHVVMLDRMRRRLIDESGVLDKWGVTPQSIPDYLALVGDSADGIPGIPKWGAKSAGALLTAYTRVEDIPEDPQQWIVKVRSSAALAENLNAARDQAALYKRLAQLRTDVPLAESLDDLRWRGANRERLKLLCERLGDTRSMERVEQWAGE